jgi:hypothetical protein
MTNLEVKAKIDRLNKGGQLSLDEQKAVCKSLLRANHRIRDLKAEIERGRFGLKIVPDSVAS